MNTELLVSHQNLINKHVGLYEKYKQLREVAELLAKALENIGGNDECIDTSEADLALTRWNELNQKKVDGESINTPQFDVTILPEKGHGEINTDPPRGNEFKE